MATVGQINEHDVFTCPICLETLKSPKSLPCLHTFCETCIGEFIISTEQRADQKLSNYPCPVCRTVVTPNNPEDEASQWAASLPHNYTILSSMDNSKSVKQECHLCKRRDKISEATQWCRDCTEAFCEECLQMHSLMKLFADHKIVQIENMDTPTSTNESDLSMISDCCPVHTSKVLEAFCFDHQELCCVLCLTLQHRKCENVQAIEEMRKLHKNRCESLETELNETKEKINEMMKEKRIEKETIDITFCGIEENARQAILSVKAKLDDLLILFLKEMRLTQDEQNFDFESQMKTFEELFANIEKIRCAAKTVLEHGTLNQMFIHCEKSKIESKFLVKEASQVLNKSSKREFKLVICDTLKNVEGVDYFGKIDFTTTTIKDTDKFARDFFPLSSIIFEKTLDLDFECISLKHYKTMHFKGFDIAGGAFISDDIVVAGGSENGTDGKMIAVDVSSGNIIDKHSLPKKVKRIAYDYESKSLFVSCYGSKLYRLEFIDKFNSLSTINIKDDADNQYNGGVCVSKGILYILNGKAVQKINTNDPEVVFETCFDVNVVNINRYYSNGLAIDSFNKRLFYTSKDYELVCTSLKGDEIFRFKGENIGDIKSVAVSLDSVAFIGRKSIYSISSDGKKARNVLNELDKLNRIRDLCLDKSCKRLCVFGFEFIEIYDVLF